MPLVKNLILIEHLIILANQIMTITHLNNMYVTQKL